MHRHADRKQLARDLAAQFGLGYHQALTALTEHTPPTGEEIAAAQKQTAGWDPLFYSATTTSLIPPELADGVLTSTRQGTYALAVPDPVTAGITPLGPEM
ncbi:hypothetical protein [Kitasatospora sp. GP82]|uniref:hypothetical protein n=1 Tax=Kitasatospora sp. GP82 TaxID=3035089 RepID=UPI0024769BEE|nr:hypothetical protein [Kitasatospora sp. GP82]MDH6130343.1 hypothetical protein [Kitasatospora sp. GP82]